MNSANLQADYSEYQNLKKRNIFLMIFLTVITFSFYIPYWFFQQYILLNRLPSKEKVKVSSVIVLIIMNILYILFNILTVFLTNESSSIYIFIDRIYPIIYGIAVFVCCMKIKYLLEEYLDISNINNIRLGRFFCLFLSIFYVQHKINVIRNKLDSIHTTPY